MNSIYLNIRKVTNIINKRLIGDSINNNYTINESFYEIDRIITKNESYEKIKDLNEVKNIMESFIVNKRYKDFNKYFSYLVKNKNNNPKYLSLLDEVSNIISTLDTDILFENFGYINYDLVSNFVKIDDFNKKYNTFTEWGKCISDSVYELMKNKEDDISIKNTTKIEYFKLLNRYNELFGTLDNKFEFLEFIFNSLIYYMDTKNIIPLLHDKIDIIFTTICNITKDNFINNDFGINIDNNYIYISNGIVSKPLNNDLFDYSSTLDLIKYIKSLDDFQFDDIKNCRRLISSCINYLSRIFIKSNESELIFNELNNILSKILSSEFLNTNQKMFIVKIDDISADSNCIYKNFINTYNSHCNNYVYKYDDISLDFNTGFEINKYSKPITLVEYINNRIGELNNAFLEFIGNSKDDIIPIYNLDKNNYFSIIEYINDRGQIIIPFGYSTNFDSEVKIVSTSNKYTIIKYNYIYYIIDNLYLIEDKDVNTLRNLGLEYSLISPNISVIESLVNNLKYFEDNLNEGSKIGNKLKIWRDSLKVQVGKARDGEVKISNQIDNTAARLQDDIKVAFTSKNREAIIKGRVIPSLSQLIKLALATGAIGYFINPIAGALSFLGAMAISSKATKQERKVILDEIEVKIKVMNKKIAKAEAEDNMKDYENYLKIKKVLETERKKILYKLDDYTKLDSYKNDGE